MIKARTETVIGSTKSLGITGLTIGTSSDSIPAVAEGMVMFAAPEGIVAIGNRISESTNNFGLIVILVSVAIVTTAILAWILKRQRKPSKNVT